MIFLGLTGAGGNQSWYWLGIGGVIFLIILISSMSDTLWLGGIGMGGLTGAIPALLAVGIVVGIMFWVIRGGGGN